MTKVLPLLQRGLDVAVYPLFVLLLILPSLVFEVATEKTYSMTAEYLIVTLAWSIVVLVAAARAFSGRAILSGSAGSWARRLSVALLVWMGFASLTGYNASASWSYFLTVAAYMLLGQSLLDWLEGHPRRRTFVLGTLFALVVLQGIVCLLQYFRVPLSDWGASLRPLVVNGQLLPGGFWIRDFLLAMGSPAREGVITGALGNINYIAEFLVLTVPACVLWALSSGKIWLRAFGGLSVVLIGLVLIATGARAPLAGFVVAGVLSAGLALGWDHLRPGTWMRSNRGRLGFAFMALVVVALLFVGGQRLAAKLSPSALVHDSSAVSRLTNWESTLKIWADHPIKGTGLGGFKLLNQKKLFETHPNGVPEVVAFTRFDQSHNEPLQVLAELGLPGLLLALGALLLWLRETLNNAGLPRHLRWGLVWGVIGLLLAGCFGFPLHIPLTALAFVVLISLGLSRNEAPPSEGPPGRRLALGLVGVVVLGTVGEQAVQKGVWPQYVAHRYLYVANKLKDANALPAAETVLALADRHNRFRADTRWELIQLKVLNQKPDEALALLAASQQEGLPIDASHWKARALELKGDLAGAKAAYETSTRFYPPSNEAHKRALLRLKSLESGQTTATGTP